ncbi:MAG: hypothetical protein ACUVT6_03905 [Thermodesulfobacteriota bacterium]
MILPLLQLLLAVFAIYSALKFEEEIRLVLPLLCLIFMLIISRIDKIRAEKENARKSFLKSEMEKISKGDAISLQEKDFFTIETLLWPKSELLFLDAVHSVFKDLGFIISPSVHYQFVDRIIKIPKTSQSFGLHVMMAEKEANKNHPKILRALQFEKEKKENEKSLIIACTHFRLPLAERTPLAHISKELGDLLSRSNITLITAHHLYELWRKTKNGEINIFDFFHRIYSYRGPLFSPKETEERIIPLLPLPIQ